MCYFVALKNPVFYFFEQVFYSSIEFNKPPINASGYTPNMLHPEYGKKVALGNLTMVKKSKFEVIKKLRYDVRMGASFCSVVNKTKFNKWFPALLEKKQQLPGPITTHSTSSIFSYSVTMGILQCPSQTIIAIDINHIQSLPL